MAAYWLQIHVLGRIPITVISCSKSLAFSAGSSFAIGSYASFASIATTTLASIASFAAAAHTISALAGTAGSPAAPTPIASTSVLLVASQAVGQRHGRRASLALGHFGEQLLGRLVLGVLPEAPSRRRK